MANLNQKALMKMSIWLPTPERQRQTVSAVRQAWGWLQSVATESAAAAKLIGHLDQANLAKAFRGELVPQDPNDEPAALLLERIRAARVAEPKPKRGRRKPAPGAIA